MNLAREERLLYSCCSAKGAADTMQEFSALDSETVKLEFPPQHLNCNEGHTMTRVEFRVCDLAHTTV